MSVPTVAPTFFGAKVPRSYDDWLSARDGPASSAAAGRQASDRTRQKANSRDSARELRFFMAVSSFPISFAGPPLPAAAAEGGARFLCLHDSTSLRKKHALRGGRSGSFRKKREGAPASSRFVSYGLSAAIFMF